MFGASLLKVGDGVSSISNPQVITIDVMGSGYRFFVKNVFNGHGFVSQYVASPLLARRDALHAVSSAIYQRV